jgi:hypothetical protein
MTIYSQQKKIEHLFGNLSHKGVFLFLGAGKATTSGKAAWSVGHGAWSF